MSEHDTQQHLEDEALPTELELNEARVLSEVLSEAPSDVGALERPPGAAVHGNAESSSRQQTVQSLLQVTSLLRVANSQLNPKRQGDILDELLPPLSVPEEAPKGWFELLWSSPRLPWAGGLAFASAIGLALVLSPQIKTPKTLNAQVSSAVGRSALSAQTLLAARSAMTPGLPKSYKEAYGKADQAGGSEAEQLTYEQLLALQVTTRKQEPLAIGAAANQRVDLYCRLAEAALELERHVDALSWVRLGLRISEDKVNVFVAELWSLQGRALLLSGKREAAAESFAKAIAVHEQLLLEHLDEK